MCATGIERSPGLVPLAFLLPFLLLLASAAPLHAQHPRVPDPNEPRTHALAAGLDTSGSGGIGATYLRRLDAIPVAIGAGAHWPGLMPQVQLRSESTVPSPFPGGISALHARHLSLGVLFHPETRIGVVDLPAGATLFLFGGMQLWPTRAMGAFLDMSVGLGAPLRGEATALMPMVRFQFGWGW